MQPDARYCGHALIIARRKSSQSGIELQHYVQRGQKLMRKVSHRSFEVTKRLFRNMYQLIAAFCRDPRIVRVWSKDIWDALSHFGKWVVTGFRLFGADVRASSFLMKRVVQGYPLTIRERQLLVRTTSDCLKLIPFSFFIIVPFAELALPLFLRLCPNMLPSTFFEQKYDNATLARKLKAKEEMAEFWQLVVAQRTKEICETDDHKHSDKAEELQAFQEKLVEGKKFPNLTEIMRFSRLFQEEFKFSKMSTKHLSVLSRMLGLPQASVWWPGHLELQLRHHLTNLRREDRDYLWEGVDSLNKKELIEACRKRAIRFHEVTEADMRKDLSRWLELSAHRQIPISLLLWIQSFYLRAPETADADCSELQMQVPEDDKPQLEAKEAFHGMAQRRKKDLENVQHKLEELRHEIDEVIDHRSDRIHDDEDSGTVSSHSAEHGTTPELDDKEHMQQRIKELRQALSLHKEVVKRQKLLLDHQLKFLGHMRSNEPTHKQDAGKILLDQRVRLMEMMRSFEADTEEIDNLLSNADSLGVVEDGALRQADPTPVAPWGDVDASAIFKTDMPVNLPTEMRHVSGP